MIDSIKEWIEHVWNQYGKPAYVTIEGFIEFVEKVAFRPRYDGDHLHRKIKEMLGDKQLHETLTNVIIPTFDMKLVHPVVFSSYKVSFSSFLILNSDEMITKTIYGAGKTR